MDLCGLVGLRPLFHAEFLGVVDEAADICRCYPTRVLLEFLATAQWSQKRRAQILLSTMMNQNLMSPIVLMILKTHMDPEVLVDPLDIMDLTSVAVPCVCCQQFLELKFWSLRMDNVMELDWMRL